MKPHHPTSSGEDKIAIQKEEFLEGPNGNYLV